MDRMLARAALLLPIALLSSGCVARAALDVVTAPVKVVGKAADLATTSQSEADETRGRDIRRREEQLGRLQRHYEEKARDCENGNDRACREAIALRREIEMALPGVPVEQRR